MPAQSYCGYFEGCIPYTLHHWDEYKRYCGSHGSDQYETHLPCYPKIRSPHPGWVSDKIRRQFLHAPQGRFALSCWHRTAAAINFGKGCFSASILSFKQDCMRQTPVSYKIDERLFGFIIAIKVIQQQSFSPERVSVKIILSRNVQRPLRRWLHRQSELLPDRLCTYQHHKKQKMEPSVYVSWSDLR